MEPCHGNNYLYGVEPKVILQAAIFVIRGEIAEGRTLLQTKYDSVTNFKGIRELLNSDDNDVILKWLQGYHSFTPSNIDHFFEKVFLEFYLTDPELLSKLKLLENIGFKGHNRYLNDYPCEAYHERNRHFQKNFEHSLSQSSCWGKVSNIQMISWKAMKWIFHNHLENYQFSKYPINQLSGYHIVFNSLMMTAIIENDTDVQNYVSRIMKSYDKFQMLSDDVRRKCCCNAIPPIHCLLKATSSIRSILEDLSRDKNRYIRYVRIAYKANTNSSLPIHLEDQIRSAIKTKLIPGLQCYLEEMEKCKAVLSDDDPVGVLRIQTSEDVYSNMLKWHTTSNIGPQEVHRLGLKQLKIYRDKAMLLITKLHENGDPQLNPKYPLNANLQKVILPKCKGDVFTDIHLIIKNFSEKTRCCFNKLPKLCCQVQELPSEISGTCAYYRDGSLDLLRPGTFQVRSTHLSQFLLKSLVAHESIPGHHYQIQRRIENAALPYFRRCCEGCFTAFNEGWALYAEWLCNELGLFRDEKGNESYYTLGYYNYELLRCCRLVVDTGLHYLGWTRSQAIDFMMDNSGYSRVSIEDEVDRYCVYPGQACSYKIGQLKILELREILSQHKGFNIKDFHDKLLDLGSLPLVLVEEEMLRWGEKLKSFD